MGMIDRRGMLGLVGGAAAWACGGPQLGPATRPPARARAAAIQFCSEMGNPALNRERLTGFIRQAAGQGAQIVVLPETCIPGYLSYDLANTWQAPGRAVEPPLRGVAADSVAETVPGPSSRQFAALARELRIYLTIPLLEVDPSSRKYFNTVLLAGPDGRLLLHYRKLNPWPFAEDSWASPGDRGLAVADTEFGRLGVLICFDIHRQLEPITRAGASTLLYSIAWVDRPGSWWFRAALPFLARKHQVNIVGANWTVPSKPDWDGYGQSLIVDRNGQVLARASKDVGEEVVVADLPALG